MIPIYIPYLDKYKNDVTKFQRKIKLFNEQTNVKRLAGIEKKFGKNSKLNLKNFVMMLLI